jgi:putative hydrolase of the HAD superfamily
MISREPPTALLLDLDGVVRRFDPDRPGEIERRYGLPDGALARSAFTLTRIRPALVGAESHASWLESIADDLAPAAGGVTQASMAVEEWQADRGVVVPEVVELVRGVRAAGIPVGLATNATDRLDADLDLLGLVAAFDAVINSSVIGAPKPSAEYFEAACLAVRREPARCLFVDDDDRNVRGARAAGLAAVRWSGTADIRYVRAALGSLVDRGKFGLP